MNRFSETLKSISFPIALHLSIAVPLAAILGIWVDEAYTIATISGSLSHTITRAIGFELQPPLYFILMNLWGKMGSSVLFLRGFSISCVILTIWLSYKLSRELFPDIYPGLFPMAVAINPYTIWAATEIRLYAYLIFLTSCIMYTFYKGFMSENHTSKNYRRWFLISCAVSLYTQYYTVFLLAALFCGLIILKKWVTLKKLFWHYVLAIALFLPMFLSALWQAMEHTKSIVVNNTLFNYLSVGTRFLRYIVRLDWTSPFIYMPGYLFFLAGFIYVLCYCKKYIIDNYKIVYVVIFWITLSFFIILNIVNHELVNITHTAILFLPSLLALFSLFSLIYKTRMKIMILPVFFLVAIINFTFIAIQYKPMAKLGDFKNVATYITNKEFASQGIFVFPSNHFLPFSYHYSGINVVTPIPCELSDTYYDISRFAIRSEEDIVVALRQKHVNPMYIWIVNWTSCEYLGVNFGCEILEKYISNYYTIEDDKLFYSSRVRLLRRKDHI